MLQIDLIDGETNYYEDDDYISYEFKNGFLIVKTDEKCYLGYNANQILTFYSDER